MRSSIVVALACALALTSMPSAQPADSLKAAADALSTSTIKTLQFTGSGANFSVGQNFSPSEPWPRVTVKSYTASINYDTGSMRQELLREMGTVMPRGGGAPFTGEQRQNQVVSGNYAWNVVAAASGAAPAPAAPAPGNAVERMLAMWATPQGFVKAAMTSNATTKKAKGGTEVTFTVGGKYKMTGIINAQNQVERVQTWIDQPIVGDMLVETVYSGYKDFGGVMFPSRIVQTQDGFASLDLTITSVTANPAVDITVPDNVRTAQPAPVRVESAKLADGVFYLTGGSHHSLAVEMKDHIVLVDVPQTAERALAVIAKAKEVIPNKPIRYLVTSHHHWDHLGGIRTAMDEGATIVTHQTNKAFLERVANTPHTLNPDRLSTSKKSVKIQTVAAKGTLSDGTRTIELHLLTNFDHSGDMLVVYLPKEKLLAEPDAFTAPATPTTPLVVTAVPYAVALYDNIQRLKLDVNTIAPFHGARMTDVAELARAAGKESAK
ncbi:MAG TPA: MBL fold metallo-hydrolase [Vicinamibacterales bacterium]|nr:MBL fold metallo-hydrolase [Vicinamibacterales bacterium]